MQTVLDASPQKQPVHIHVAEQQKRWMTASHRSGLRPVEWLYRHQPVDERWCLIHATHVTPEETRMMAASGAVAGLCLTTEANLGDGIFPGADYLPGAVHRGIGSDSHISVSVTEDLRWFEYGQRLNQRRRNLLHLPDEPYIGNVLYQGRCRAVAERWVSQSANWRQASVQICCCWIAAILSPATAGDRERLNRWIFACAANPIKGS